MLGMFGLVSILTKVIVANLILFVYIARLYYVRLNVNIN